MRPDSHDGRKEGFQQSKRHVPRPCGKRGLEQRETRKANVAGEQRGGMTRSQQDRPCKALWTRKALDLILPSAFEGF